MSYGFGDASGTGFGASFAITNAVVVHQGVWGSAEDNSSSNFQELSNLVSSLEFGGQRGNLDLTEVWIFTDNTTAEAVFYKGHSPSPKLNYLALRLCLLEMGGRCKIHMVPRRVSGWYTKARMVFHKETFRTSPCTEVP